MGPLMRLVFMDDALKFSDPSETESDFLKLNQINQA